MVSEFLCECHGAMKLNQEQRERFPEVPCETRTIIVPGKNQDGYWTAANLVDQVKKKAMPIFKILHPDADALFLFDNSQNHRCLPPDALRACYSTCPMEGKMCRTNGLDGSSTRMVFASSSQCKTQTGLKKACELFFLREASGIPP